MAIRNVNIMYVSKLKIILKIIIILFILIIHSVEKFHGMAKRNL